MTSAARFRIAYPGDIDPADIVEPAPGTGRSTASLTFPAPGG